MAELAHHFLAAATSGGELAKAIDYAVRAGERALALVAYEEAADHFERALQAYGLQDRADVPGRCDLLLALGTAQSRAGDTAAARETFLRAGGLARRLKSPPRLARAALGYGAGMGGFEFGRVDDTLIGLLQEAREALGPDDSVLKARLLGRTGDRAVLLRPLGGAHAPVAARRSTWRIGSATGRRSRRRSAPATSCCGVPRTRRRACRSAATSSRSARRPATASSCCAATSGASSASWSSATGSAPTSSWRSTRAWPATCATRCRRGRCRCTRRPARCSTAGCARPSATPTRRSRPGAACRRATRRSCMPCSCSRCAREQGRLSEVEQSLERFAREYPAAPVWRAAAAYAHAALGRTDPARRALEALTANELAEVPRDGEWLSTVALLVRVAALLGDAERSAQLGALLAPFGSRAIVTGRGAWCRDPVSRFAAMAAAAAGARSEAIARYETALAAARRWGAEPTVAAIRIELADVLASARRRRRRRRARGAAARGTG